MKFFLIPLKLFQLISTLVIIIAIFSPCEIVRKDDKYSYFRTRQYSIYEPALMYDIMGDVMESSATTMNLFKVLYAAVGLSFPTAALIVLTFLGHYLCKCVGDKLRLISNIILIAVWIPLTFAFLWTVTFAWSDDAELSNYSRPRSWVVGAGASLTLTTFLLIELLFILVFVTRDSSDSITQVHKNNVWARNYWKKGSRLVVSLNSLDLDPQCEKLKPDDL